MILQEVPSLFRFQPCGSRRARFAGNSDSLGFRDLPEEDFISLCWLCWRFEQPRIRTK